LPKKEGDAAVEATKENAITGQYPLARFLYVYVDKKPNESLLPVVQEFLKMVLSSEGQKIVEKDGYIALPTAVIEQELTKL
jgi:phosphate transport system substrate-binding protein